MVQPQSVPYFVARNRNNQASIGVITIAKIYFTPLDIHRHDVWTRPRGTVPCVGVRWSLVIISLEVVPRIVAVGSGVAVLGTGGRVPVIARSLRVIPQS